MKKMLGIDVYDAAKQRISWTFDTFENICISFSGGKDSTCMTHLVMEEAIKRNRKVGLFFLDWECQFNLTIDHVKHMFELYKDNIIPYWIALPIRTWNGCSQYEPEWIAWEEGKEDIWVRTPDELSITDKSTFPFYFDNMMFEEFTPLFNQWFGDNKRCANFIGIRTQESLNRFRAVSKDSKFTLDDMPFTTKVIDDCWNVYPIYDWGVEDIWTYYAKSGNPYNKLYDRMHQAGMTINQMRIDEPFGDTQRKGLWLYQIIEPATWAKMSLRVAGANVGALYSKEMGNILGNHRASLPEGHTWESFALSLLGSMPTTLSEHYKNKIAKYIYWHSERGYPDGIPQESDYKLETLKKAPSWRVIVKTLLKNDYWCKGLGFSPTKSSAYKKYLEHMKTKRDEWGILNE